MPPQFSLHAELEKLHRERQRRRAIGNAVTVLVVALCGAALFLKDIPRAFDGQIADAKVDDNGKRLACTIHVITASGTERLRRGGAGTCVVLRPGLHVRKEPWSFWIEGGSERIAALSLDELLIGTGSLAIALLALRRAVVELRKDPHARLGEKAARRGFLS